MRYGTLDCLSGCFQQCTITIVNGHGRNAQKENNMWIIRITDPENSTWYVAESFAEAELFLKKCGYHYVCGGKEAGEAHWALGGRFTTWASIIVAGLVRED